jgi:hypothetical protein
MWLSSGLREHAREALSVSSCDWQSATHRLTVSAPHGPVVGFRTNDPWLNCCLQAIRSLSREVGSFSKFRSDCRQSGSNSKEGK